MYQKAVALKQPPSFYLFPKGAFRRITLAALAKHPSGGHTLWFRCELPQSTSSEQQLVSRLIRQILPVSRLLRHSRDSHPNSVSCPLILLNYSPGFIPQYNVIKLSHFSAHYSSKAQEKSMFFRTVPKNTLASIILT